MPGRAFFAAEKIEKNGSIEKEKKTKKQVSNLSLDNLALAIFS